ncbi:unnamed protein product, partial [Didymodactylos carnosus]
KSISSKSRQHYSSVPTTSPSMTELYHEKRTLGQNRLPKLSLNYVINSPSPIEQRHSIAGPYLTSANSSNSTAKDNNSNDPTPIHHRLSMAPSNDLPISSTSRQTVSLRTTKMLVICSTTFLVFNSPYCAILLYSFLSKHVLSTALDIFRHFYFMSFCMNFFLYSLCGNRFRHELILLFKRFLHRCCTKQVAHKCFTNHGGSLLNPPSSYSVTRQ